MTHHSLRHGLAATALGLCVHVTVPVAAGNQPSSQPESPPAEPEIPTTQPSTPDAPVAPAEPTVSQTDEPEPQADDDQVSPEAEVSEEELRALEKALGADAEAVAEEAPPVTAAAGPVAASTVNYDLALILDVAGAWFSDEPMPLGGHDPSRTGFTFQQLELTFGASVDPYMRLDANLVFSEFGVEVEEAYVTTLALPANLQLRAGQFLTPFGRINQQHPHAWAFLDQPLVNGKFFGSEGSRGLGAELSWLSPLPWFAELTGAVTNATGECCARSFFGGDEIGVRTVADLLYTTRLAQFFPLGDAFSVLWGLSAQFGPNATGPGNRTEIYGTDLYLRYKPPGSAHNTALGLQIEFMVRSRQVPEDALQDYGGRAELVWDITERWQTGIRQEFVTGVENDPLNPEWHPDRRRLAGQVTFFPSHFSHIRMQLQLDEPEWIESPIYAVMLGLEALIGAHGAHEF